MKTKMLTDFQICISAPLIKKWWMCVKAVFVKKRYGQSEVVCSDFNPLCEVLI